MIVRGKALVLGKNIDTDQIYPGRFLDLVEPGDVGSHCLAGIDESIAPNWVKGDIVVAGTNFGCGSSREHAPIALINMGAGAVIAESFARIFFRNGINLGLPLVTCADISRKVQTGDELEISVADGMIKNLTTGETLQAEAMGEYAMSILDAGGIKNVVRNMS